MSWRSPAPWILLAALGGVFALGYLLGQGDSVPVAVRDRTRDPDPGPDPNGPAGSGARDRPGTTPRTEGRRGADSRAEKGDSGERDEGLPVFFPPKGDFPRWYRVHAGRLGLEPYDDEFLAHFEELFIQGLRRIPRRRILTTLLETYAGWRDEREEENRTLNLFMERGPSREERNREHERREQRSESRLVRFAHRLARILAPSDFRLLRWSDGGRDTLDGTPFDPPDVAGLDRPAGVDPYARPKEFAKERKRFLQWYRAYSPELKLPALEEEPLDRLADEIVLPLGRVPERATLLQIIALHREYHQGQEAANERLRLVRASGDDQESALTQGDDVVRTFFAGLRKVLTPLDYERLRQSEWWHDTCRDLGLLD